MRLKNDAHFQAKTSLPEKGQRRMHFHHFYQQKKMQSTSHATLHRHLTRIANADEVDKKLAYNRENSKILELFQNVPDSDMPVDDMMIFCSDKYQWRSCDTTIINK
ncbi:hypothetical protein JTB14_018157 [Gonioctena quinquepunctata]|nr:hypothetical protein JTB14_018157 [Gonioctena quinquepunctata]